MQVKSSPFKCQRAARACAWAGESWEPAPPACHGGGKHSYPGAGTWHHLVGWEILPCLGQQESPALHKLIYRSWITTVSSHPFAAGSSLKSLSNRCRADRAWWLQNCSYLFICFGLITQNFEILPNGRNNRRKKNDRTCSTWLSSGQEECKGHKRREMTFSIVLPQRARGNGRCHSPAQGWKE